MPYIYAQAGQTLNRISADSRISQTVSLPEGVTLSNRSPQFAVINRRVVMTNSPSHNLLIQDGNGVDGMQEAIYPMSPIPPSTKPTVTTLTKRTETAPSLTGAYRVRVSFAVKNSVGEIIAESPLGPESDEIVLNDQVLSVSDIPLATEPGVNVRRVYRTLIGGSSYFLWQDIDDNRRTTLSGAPSDELLSQLKAPDRLGNPPGSFGSSSRLELLVSWKGQLFGRSGGYEHADRDTLIWSEIRRPWAWPSTNNIPIPPIGADAFGITAIIPRRDVLGVAKRDSLHKITSPSPTSGQLRQVAEVGVVSQDSVIIYEDIVWFLSEDGIYQWGTDDTVRSISFDSVHEWFTTDYVFERSAFNRAIGFFHEGRRSLIWLLPGTGQASLNRWVEYYIDSGIWLGPHSTDEFTPMGVYSIQDSASVEYPTFTGDNGQLYRESVEGYDGIFQFTAPTGKLTHEELLNREGGELTKWVKTGYNVPLAGNSQIRIGTRLSPTIPWSLLRTVKPANTDQKPSNETSLAILVAGLPAPLLLGHSTDGQLLIHTVGGGYPDPFPFTLSIYDVQDVITGNSKVPAQDGIHMVVETQPQTAREPEVYKHWGEVSVFGDVGPGNRFSVTSLVDERTKTQPINGEIRQRARLQRIGDGLRASLAFEDDSAAYVNLYGYEINPVNLTGRR